MTRIVKPLATLLLCLTLHINANVPNPSTDIFPQDETSKGLWVKDIYYPESFHWILEPSILGDIIKLEDGSQWSVKPEDRKSLYDWILSEPVIITQNPSWFSKYNYRIVNRDTGASIAIDMSLGPLLGGEYTHWITAIDRNRREIQLEDGSIWVVSQLDTYVLGDWLLNNTIMIGANSGWLSSYEFILINVETYKYVRATQLN